MPGLLPGFVARGLLVVPDVGPGRGGDCALAEGLRGMKPAEWDAWFQAWEALVLHDFRLMRACQPTRAMTGNARRRALLAQIRARTARRVHLNARYSAWVSIAQGGPVKIVTAEP